MRLERTRKTQNTPFFSKKKNVFTFTCNANKKHFCVATLNHYIALMNTINAIHQERKIWKTVINYNKKIEKLIKVNIK